MSGWTVELMAYVWLPFSGLCWGILIRLYYYELSGTGPGIQDYADRLKDLDESVFGG